MTFECKSCGKKIEASDTLDAALEGMSNGCMKQCNFIEPPKEEG